MARVWVLGVGSFVHAMAQICREDGAEVHTYLTRSYGHYGASLCGEVYEAKRHPQLLMLLEKLLIAMILKDLILQLREVKR